MSSGFAVQGTEDSTNIGKNAVPCQATELNGSNHGAHCAKDQCMIPLRGEPGAPVYAVIDDADFELVRNRNWRAWKNHNTWYAVAGTGVLMHRLILGIHGLGRSVECDHINGNGLDNTRANIRIATRSVNMQNRRKYGGNGNYVGVKRSDNGKRWKARIYHNGKPILLGTHDTEEQAAKEYDKAALTLFGPLAHLNFPLTPRTIKSSLAMNIKQEPKYKIENGRLVNRQSNEPIPDDEPVFILRARDNIAVIALDYYLSRVTDEKHFTAVELRLNQFDKWATEHPDRMKTPDTQLTAEWLNL